MIVEPNYACLNYIAPTTGDQLADQAYNCDMSNPDRDRMDGRYCYLGYQDVDVEFESYLYSLSTTMLTDDQATVIENASSRLDFYCDY